MSRPSHVSAFLGPCVQKNSTMLLVLGCTYRLPRIGPARRSQRPASAGPVETYRTVPPGSGLPP
eukprot:7295436-Alexandrium_andersonii.AAC.1